jgi:parvulin-like peptidyl-prolyl isomerase
MRLFPVLFAVSLFAQVQIQPGAVTVGSPAARVPADSVLAVVNGAPVRASDLREMLLGAPEVARKSAASQPSEFLQWTYLLRSLSEQGHKAGMDKKEPYSDRLAWSRLQILMMGGIDLINKSTTVSEQDIRQAYEATPEQWGTAVVKILYLAADSISEPKVKAKAAALVKQLRAGAGFAQMAKLYSDDTRTNVKGGDFGEVGLQHKMPAAFKQAIFRLKPGEVTEALKESGGYYIFQLTKLNLKPLEELRPAIRQKVMQDKVEQQMNAIRREIRIDIKEQEFFQDLVARSMAGIINSPAEPKVPREIRPDTVLVVIDGVNLTAAAYTALMQTVPPGVRNKATANPDEFFRQYAMMRRLSAAAERDGLEKQQPYSGRLAYDRMQQMMQAWVDEYNNNISFGPEAVQAGYDKQISRFRIAAARVIYIPYSISPPPVTDPNAPKVMTEDEASKLAAEIVERVRGGAEFETMVTIYSQDESSKNNGGKLPPITFDDARVPEDIRTAIFNTQPGKITAPIRRTNGFYIFSVDEARLRPFAEMKDTIYEEMRQAKFQEWFDGKRKAFQIEIRDPEAFRRILAE